jgi:hypothetical protein
MPGDAAAGCVELILRVLAEVFFHGVGEWVWWWLRASGAVTVWVLTFGRVNLMEKNDTLAGIAGIILHATVIGLVIWRVVSAPDAIP